MKRIAPLILSLIVAISSAAPAAAEGFVNHGPASKFLDIEMHGFIGGAMVTENYLSCFPELKQMNTAPGASAGLGISAIFGFSDFIGLGTSLDFAFNNFRTDMAAGLADLSSVSNIFLRNSASYIRIPVFLRFGFNIASNVRWRVDGGLYYAYGLGGSQRQDIYNAQVNPLGQLISSTVSDRYGYFDSPNTFIHANHRSDIGIHAATSLLFSRHLSIGAAVDLGLKNIAYIHGGRGLVTPNVHNFTYCVTLGYTL